MRKIDEKKNSNEKAAKCISFDKPVLLKLEEIAKKENTDVSKIVNKIIRETVMIDAIYFREMKKYHYLKMQEFQYMEEQAKILNEVKGEKHG